jgi:hypothetical protein
LRGFTHLGQRDRRGVQVHVERSDLRLKLAPELLERRAVQLERVRRAPHVVLLASDASGGAHRRGSAAEIARARQSPAQQGAEHRGSYRDGGLERLLSFLRLLALDALLVLPNAVREAAELRGVLRPKLLGGEVARFSSGLREAAAERALRFPALRQEPQLIAPQKRERGVAIGARGEGASPALVGRGACGHGRKRIPLRRTLRRARELLRVDGHGVGGLPRIRADVVERSEPRAVVPDVDGSFHVDEMRARSEERRRYTSAPVALRRHERPARREEAEAPRVARGGGCGGRRLDAPPLCAAPSAFRSALASALRYDITQRDSRTTGPSSWTSCEEAALAGPRSTSASWRGRTQRRRRCSRPGASVEDAQHAALRLSLPISHVPALIAPVVQVDGVLGAQHDAEAVAGLALSSVSSGFDGGLAVGGEAEHFVHERIARRSPVPAWRRIHDTSPSSTVTRTSAARRRCA